MPSKPIYTKEMLEPICKEVFAMAQLLRKLNLELTGGNYQSLKAKILAYNIDTSHWTGQRSNIGNKQGTLKIVKTCLKDILIANSCYPSARLRLRLIKENLVKNECKLCGQGPIWNSKPLTLQLDHINGNRNDNRLENLRILCPNCHTQTDTHSGKNKKK